MGCDLVIKATAHDLHFFIPIIMPLHILENTTPISEQSGKDSFDLYITGHVKMLKL